jgi:hypothetical protein
MHNLVILRQFYTKFMMIFLSSNLTNRSCINVPILRYNRLLIICNEDVNKHEF